MNHRIAAIPGDGIGKEVVPEGMRVIDAAGRRFGFDIEWTTFDWSSSSHGRAARNPAGVPWSRNSKSRRAA